MQKSEASSFRLSESPEIFWTEAWGAAGTRQMASKTDILAFSSGTRNLLADGPAKLCLASSMVSKVSSPPAQVCGAAGQPLTETWPTVWLLESPYFNRSCLDSGGFSGDACSAPDSKQGRQTGGTTRIADQSSCICKVLVATWCKKTRVVERKIVKHTLPIHRQALCMMDLHLYKRPRTEKKVLSGTSTLPACAVWDASWKVSLSS